MTAPILNTPVEFLKGIGPVRAQVLKTELNITTFEDLVNYFPFRYVDRSQMLKIGQISSDAVYIQVKGRVRSMEVIGKMRASRLSVWLEDETGEIELVFFQGIKWLKNKLVLGKEYIVFGKPSLYRGTFNFSHPEVDPADEDTATQNEPFQPFYSTSQKLIAKGFTPRSFSKVIFTLLQHLRNAIPEIHNPGLLKQMNLMGRQEAYFNIHFPRTTGHLDRARFRIKFDEFYLMQLQLLKLKLVRQVKMDGFNFATVGDHFNGFYHNYLPFPLTNAQKKVIREIRKDLGSGSQMNRLLQGDVGSGKTLVALMAMLIAIDNGYQACIMAPTEILATQHYKSICRFLRDMPVKTGLLTGSTKPADRREIHAALRDGTMHILIGTHALIEDEVKFMRLGLAVVDEQHRFGVQQRARLWEKSSHPPHVLVMTATPIPRTLAMTLYGDLDVSMIDELPPGRKPIQTHHFTESKRLQVFRFLKKEIHEGRQIYIVYPLIEESGKLELQDLTDGFDTVSRYFPLPDYQISVVHGQLKAADKELEMNRFQQRKTDIMMATTVIEVGVDIPNATVMVIENAERFGLAQLHQLRGRVGRGGSQSYCLLMTGYKLTKEAKTRIQTMVETNDGFKIAEVDLQLRGPGDMHGTQQSGIAGLNLASLTGDTPILKVAREMAIRTLEDDPDLSKPENRMLNDYLSTHTQDWSRIS